MITSFENWNFAIISEIKFAGWDLKSDIALLRQATFKNSRKCCNVSCQVRNIAIFCCSECFSPIL